MRQPLKETVQHPKTLLVGVYAPYNHTKDIQSYFDEFINLVKSNDIKYDETIFMRIRHIDSTYFITQGKLEEVQEACKKHEIEEVIFSEPLTPQQERNLSELLKVKVFDRTQLILEIFEKGAHSAEGKIQVDLAMLQHRKSRLAGRGIHLSQQAGRIGVRGPGETAKEKETQHIERLISKLRKELHQLEKTRETQRKKRLLAKVPQICLIGYTNAGKSSILNALTKSIVLAEDKLFATLDTTTKELYINKKKIGLLSDTVGFIQLLPHNLIEAFKSTLAELQYANLLLHVIDISDPNWESHIKVVHEILEDLNIDKEILYVFNKVDKLTHKEIEILNLERYQPNVLISTLSKEGIEPLVKFLAEWHEAKNIKKTNIDL